MMQPGCSTATTRPRKSPGRASLLESAFEDTWAANIRLAELAAARAIPNVPANVFRQCRRVSGMRWFLLGSVVYSTTALAHFDAGQVLSVASQGMYFLRLGLPATRASYIQCN